jgi:hypothetical protein
MDRNEERSDRRDVGATYRDEAEAAEALKKMRAAGVPVEAHHEDRPGAPVDPLQQARDIDALGAGPGPVIPAMTRRQYIGGFAGSAAGTLAAGGLAAIIAAILVAANVIGWTTFAAIIVGGAVAGAVAGLVLGGSAGGQAQIEREDRTTAMRVEAHPRSEAERERAEQTLQERRRRTG